VANLVTCRHRQVAPHVSRVERSPRLRTPRTGFAGKTFAYSPALNDCGSPMASFSASPQLWCSGKLASRTHPRASGRMSGLLFAGLHYKSSGPAKDYSDKPPSSWTSTSRCIQLYRATTSGIVTTLPLARVVNSGLPGVVDCLLASESEQSWNQQTGRFNNSARRL